MPYFLEQLGCRPTDAGRPLVLTDDHGGSWSEWPEDIRILETPVFEQWLPKAVPSGTPPSVALPVMV